MLRSGDKVSMAEMEFVWILLKFNVTVDSFYYQLSPAASKPLLNCFDEEIFGKNESNAKYGLLYKNKVLFPDSLGYFVCDHSRSLSSSQR